MGEVPVDTKVSRLHECPRWEDLSQKRSREPEATSLGVTDELMAIAVHVWPWAPTQPAPWRAQGTRQRLVSRPPASLP